MKLRKFSHALFSTLLAGCMLSVAAPVNAYADSNLVNVDEANLKARPTIAIDAGHGGFDSGACSGGLREADITLKIAKYLRQELINDDFNVVMIRNSDTSLTNNTPDELKARPEYAKDHGADVYVSLHINSNGGHGAEVWIPNQSSYKYKETVVPARAAARDTLDAIVGLGFNDRGLKHRIYPQDGSDESIYPDNSPADYLGVIRYARRLGMPAYLVEHGFIDHSADNWKFSSDSYLRKLAHADAIGIKNNFKNAPAYWPTRSGGDVRITNGKNYLKNGMVTINGDTYYVDSNGYALRNTMKKVNGNTYYFDNDGERYRGLKTIDGKQYYFDWNNYSMRHDGWIWFWRDKAYRYADLNTGELLRGYQNIDGKTYLFNSNGLSDGKPVKAVVSLVNDGGKLHIKQGDKYLKNQWCEYNDERYYADENGNCYNNGPQVIKGEQYFFYKDGTAAHGLVTYNNKQYYYDWSTYKLRHDGWIYFWANENYRFADLKTGELVRGLQNINGDTYYFDKNGFQTRGLLTIDGKEYYFDWSSYKLRHDGWIYFWKDDNYRFADLKTGELLRGVHKIDGDTYFFDKNGLRDRGLIEVNGKEYYYDWSTYKLRKDGWIWFWREDGYRFADQNTGELLRGYQTIDGKEYYFDEKGISSGKDISDSTEFVVEDGVARLRRGRNYVKNSWCSHKDEYYYLDSNGYALHHGPAVIDGQKYFFYKDGTLARGLVTYNGKQYYYDWSTYQLRQDGWIWFWRNEAYRYADRNTGELYTGIKSIDGKYYKFDKNGLSNKVALPKEAVTAKDPNVKQEPIMGSSKVTQRQMVNYFNKTAGTRKYPTEELAKLGAPTIEEFVKQVYEEATAEGVRAEVLFAQVIHETGYLQSDYAKKQANFGGLGVTGPDVKGEEFTTAREGLRAQAQHLKAYASTASCNGTVVDKRFNNVKRGSCTNVNDLGGGKWAASPVDKYSGAVLKFMNGMYNS